MVAARTAFTAWMRTKSRAVNTAGALLDSVEQADQVRQLIEFVVQVGVLGNRNLLDRELAQALFGTDMTRTCSDLEGGPREALSELCSDWSSRVQPAIEATRRFLQFQGH